jgi:hypothetical protein
MNEAILALCKKPAIGIAMWLSSMCATNQALKDTFVDLAKEGIVVDQKIEVPMDERYSLMLMFSPSEKYDPANPHRSFFSHFCTYPREQREAWRTPNQRLALDLEVKASNGQSVSHTVFNGMCERDPGNPRDLFLGNIELKRGTFRLLIANKYPVTLESTGKIQIILRGTGAGYP